MTYLLDTHALAWWLYDPRRVSDQTFELISDPDQEIFVSAVSAYEVTNKYRLGKWPELERLATKFHDTVLAEGMNLLAITIGDAANAGLINSEHRDPFDRIIAAQSMRGRFIVLTKDKKLADLGAITFW